MSAGAALGGSRAVPSVPPMTKSWHSSVFASTSGSARVLLIKAGKYAVDQFVHLGHLFSDRESKAVEAPVGLLESAVGMLRGYPGEGLSAEVDMSGGSQPQADGEGSEGVGSLQR